MEVKTKSEWPWLQSSKGNRWRDVYVQGMDAQHRNAWKSGATGAGNGRILTLDTLRGHGKAVCCIEASGDRLVTGGEDKKIRVWSVSKRKCVTTLRGHTKGVTTVRMDASMLLLSGGAEGAVRLWELSKGKCLRTLEAAHFKGGVSSVDLTAHLGVSAGGDAMVRFWDLEHGGPLQSAASTAAVHCVRLDGPQRALWACGDGSIRLFDVRQKAEVGQMLGHTDSVNCVALGTGRRNDHPFKVQELICSASSDGTVKLWDVRMLRHYSTLRTPEDALYSVDFDASVIVCGGKAHALYLFDVASEEPVRTLKQHHTDMIHGVSVGTGGRIFSCSRDKMVKVLTSSLPTNKSTPTASSSKRPFLRLSEMFTSSSGVGGNGSVTAGSPPVE